MQPVEVIRGDGSIVLGLPHTGTHLPEEVFSNLTPLGQRLEGTDWHVHRLYGGFLDDCHSIRSRIPFLFGGLLPHFNIGTDSGQSCSAVIESAVLAICQSVPHSCTVLNGRFKGGWITRHYGRPQDGIHAIQMELAQSTHLASESLPFAYDLEKAKGLRVHLRSILNTLADLASSLGGRT